MIVYKLSPVFLSLWHELRDLMIVHSDALQFLESVFLKIIQTWLYTPGPFPSDTTFIQFIDRGAINCFS